MKEIEVTRTQAAVLKIVRNYLTKNGYPPTRQEISDGMGWSSTTSATNAIVQLEDL